MKSKKNPVFRLTVIFISVVIASGSILAYFSINNIANLKELTEKRALEEQHSLAAIITDNIQDEINEVAGEFPDDSPSDDKDYITAVKLFDTVDLVGTPFIVDRNGKFIWPWFIYSIANRIDKVPSPRYIVNYAQAEKAEFIEQDFRKASQHYLASLKESTNILDSSKTLNALARLSVKMNDTQQALLYYSTITSRYFSVVDRYGFPYVYYAIPPLIRISSPLNKEKVLREIEFFIYRMESGDIPLNHSSNDMLDQVTNWMENQVTGDQQISELKESIQKIRTRLAFIDRNANEIRDLLASDKVDGYPLIMGRYKALNGISPDPEELILINHDADYSTGFTIGLEQLWSSMMAKGLTTDTEFEYDKELIKKENGLDAQGTNLVTLAEISPYFQGHQVMIRLKNERLIDEFVRRRSWIYGISLTLLLGGMILGVHLILRDISREEHLARLRADFISNVTHELKTPLTSVQLFTESIMLNRVKSETDKKEYLKIILKETESLKRMINNILDFSKKEKGKLEYNFEKVNVTALVNMAINDLDYWLVEKKFILDTQIEDNVIATADPGALKQAIINLLSNAIKFSRDRKEIFVALKKENGTIRIEIEDKGIGIPDDQKDLIFEEFYRVGQRNAEDISGTGLGLSVTKEIVEAHHGKILVESRLDKGSKFTIILNSTQELTG
jgi:signal transduction histidine kinase